MEDPYENLIFWTSANDKLTIYFSYFAHKIGFDIAFKLSPKRRQFAWNAKAYILYSRRNKRAISKCRPLKYLHVNNALYEKRIISSMRPWTAQIRLIIHAVWSCASALLFELKLDLFGNRDKNTRQPNYEKLRDHLDCLKKLSKYTPPLYSDSSWNVTAYILGKIRKLFQNVVYWNTYTAMRA